MKNFSLGSEEVIIDGMRLITVRTSANDVVRIEGSVLGGENLLSKTKGPVAMLTADLLDAGTKKRSKDSIREGLSARGASLSFTAQGNRLAFSGSCLPEDTAYLLSVVVECLTEASFPVKEVELAKTRSIAELVEAKTDTRAQASAEFSRLVFDTSHANYSVTTESRIASVKQVTQKELVEFRKKIGYEGLMCVVAGDVNTEKVLRDAVKIFHKLPKGSFTVLEQKPNKKVDAVRKELIHIKDKANVDVYLGSAIPMTYDDERYIPFSILLSLLGGRGLSTGHLMRTIRERDGLTYGIYASLGGLEDGNDGAFNIWATFAPRIFEKGVAAIKKEMKFFLGKRISPEALESKKSEILGNYLVGLSTTRGLASTLHRIAREGKQLNYVEKYPEIISKVSVKEVMAVVPLIPLQRLSLSAAGSFSA